MSFEKGIVKNLHYGDILIKFNEILDSCDKKIPFISRDMNFEKIKNAILKNGDVVIADAAEDEAVGKCTEIFNISQNEQIISGLHTIPCRPNIDFAQGFLGYYMNSNSYHSQLVPLMQGIKVLSLSKSSLQDTLITFPRTKKEQARIGTFFRQLDRLVALHQCNCNMATRPCEWSSGLRAIAWEQRKLGEVGTTFTGLSGKKASDFGHGKASLITYMNVFSNPIANPNMIENVEVDSRQREVEVGDVFFTTSSETPEEVGMSSVLKKKIGITYLNSFCFGFRPSVKFDLDYLAFMLRSESVRKQIKLLAQGISRFNIAKTKMMYIDIQVPKIDEQIAIGKYFAQLDRLITLHQRKRGRLENIKKAMLEKMFPKNGADVPEVRFAGFTEDWEQRNVGDLLIERDEQAPKSNKYPLMAFIANEGVAPKGERYDRSSLVTDTVNKLYKKTEFGDFIYSSNNLETGSIGLNNYGKASISPVYSIFFPTQIADSDFLGRRLVRKDFINEMVKWRQGVIYGQWRIHESDFVKIKIFVPSVEEQSRIGSFFRHLDRLITLHQRKHILLT